MIKKGLFVILISMLFLTGCWDQRELSDITVVTGMAVDKSDEEKYTLTAEGLNAEEISGKTSSGFAPSIVFSIEGETLSELSQKMNIGVSKNFIYSHMRTLIISEDIAKEGMMEFLDFLERNREIRDDFNILIARNVKASDILKVTYQFQKSSALKLYTQLRSMVKNWGGDPNVRLNDLVQAWSSPGRQPAIAAVTIQGNPKKGVSSENMKKVTPDAIVTLDSLAIFKDNKLKGFLSLEDTRNYLWINDDLSRTSFSVPCAKDKYFIVKFYNSKTRPKAKLVKGIPVFHLKIRGEGYLDGTQCKEDLTNVKNTKKYEKETEKVLEKHIAATIKKVQDEYGSDIFGFGEMLYRQDYKNFKKVEKHWDETFKDAVVHIDVTVRIRRTGIRTKSLLTNQK